jgi:hypothetical protein
VTPEAMAKLVARWVRIYTRDLPTPIAQRRSEEIDADLHDHIAHERSHGTSDRRVALSSLSRMVHGLRADASWRDERVTHNRAYRSAIGVARATGLILLVPLLAMQFSDEVLWGPADFVAAGVLLFSAGLTYQLVARNAGNSAYRIAVGVAVGAALLLVWLVGAVGVIGEDGDRADMMYAGVLAVGTIGAVVARFRPGGMARALLAMALAQAVVAVIALLAGKHQAPISSVAEILGLNGFFVALFIASACLFREAARKQPPGDATPKD